MHAAAAPSMGLRLDRYCPWLFRSRTPSGTGGRTALRCRSRDTGRDAHMPRWLLLAELGQSSAPARTTEPSLERSLACPHAPQGGIPTHHYRVIPRMTNGLHTSNEGRDSGSQRASRTHAVHMRSDRRGPSSTGRARLRIPLRSIEFQKVTDESSAESRAWPHPSPTQYCSISKESHPMDSSATIAVTGAERLLAWACLADRREAGVCSQWVCGLARCDREGRTACFDA